MRTKRTIYNSMASLMLQIISVICGFVLPRMFLSRFGSEVNGAVASISQFISYISLLEMGVGGVTRAALYKPLAERDTRKISGIVKATESFFHKLSGIFILYTLILSILFQEISHTKLSWIFVASLVWILSMDQFSQYYFGISYSILLQADQRGYIGSILQIFAVVLNTLVSVILLQLGANVHTVKLASVSVFALRPVLLHYIVRKQYGIIPEIAPDEEALSQKWSGFGHHIAFYIHNNVDIMVITVMLGLKWTSIYSIYYMIVNGIKNIVTALIGAGESTFGNMIAKKEQKLLNKRFHMVETLTSMIVVTFFTTTGMLLLDFIRIYTRGISDINYILPSVAVLFALTEACHCIKQTYHSVVLAAGHYRETQAGAFIEAGLNLVLSIVLGYFFRLSGVLIATLIATIYRMIDYIIHLKRNVLFRPVRVFVFRQILNIANVLMIIVMFRFIPFWIPDTYFTWTMKAFPVFFISAGVTLLLNVIFYRSDLHDAAKLLGNLFCDIFKRD